ncbi:MAG: glycosyltransferase family 39 protein, partial [Candidatus Beckwithbacteria bacterium]
DLTPLAVRFPSALFGSLTVLLVFLFAKQFFKKPTVPLLSALFLCLSPWHLQLSRAGFEANLGLFLVTLGAWLFTKGAKKPLWLILSVIPLGLSMYAYHANRVLVPLLGLSFGLLYLKKLLTNKSKSLIAIFLFILISLPLSLRLNTPEVKQRFLETSAFSDSALVIESNQLISQDGGGPVSRLIHHRYWFYTKTFLDHYLDHFNFNYLFISGDSNPRHSTQLVGSLYLIQLPLLIFGLFSLFKNKKSELIPILVWIILAPIPAALTKATPHALRSLLLLIPLTILCAYGAVQLIKSKLLIYIFTIILLFEFSRHQYIYHFNYPKLHQSQWQYGYQELMEYINQNKDKYDTIYVTRKLGRPSIYYWFYSKTKPSLVQIANNKVNKDQGEYLEFQNIKFELPKINTYNSNSLIVVAKDDIINLTNPVKIIKDLNNAEIFKIYEN